MQVQERPRHDTRDVSGALAPELHLRAADLARIAAALVAYHARFAPLCARQEQRDRAAVYRRGLLVTDVPRKNVEARARRLLGAADGADRRVRALQHFGGAGARDPADPRPDLWPRTTVRVTRPLEATATTVEARDLAALLPPAPALRLSVAEVRVLLRTLRPLPCLDRSAAVALWRDQRRHKRAAYWSHRTRRPQRLADLRPPNLDLSL